MMILVGVIILAAVALFGYMLYTSKSKNSETATTTQQVATTTAGQYEELLTVQHQTKDGVHAVAGEFALPTPCHDITAEPFFTGQGSSTVEIRFTIKQPEEGQMCAQVVTGKKFLVRFDAPPNVTITATVDGKAAQLNLVEVPAAQKLEGVSDEFFKG